MTGASSAREVVKDSDFVVGNEPADQMALSNPVLPVARPAASERESIAGSHWVCSAYNEEYVSAFESNSSCGPDSTIRPSSMV